MTSVRVLHDGSFHRPGGGARVAKELAIALNAPVTVGHCAKPEFWTEDGRVEADIAFQSALHSPPGGYLPRPAKELRLGQLFRTLDIDQDIIVTSGTAAKWLVPKSHQYHVHYCHVPPPRFYGEGQGSQSFLGWGLQNGAALLDQHFGGFVDQYLANSQWTRERVHKHYRRDAPVLNPPVRTDAFEWLPPSEDTYFVMIAGRLVGMKRPQLVAEAFRDIEDAKLVVIGDGPLRGACTAVDGVEVYPDLSDSAVELAVGRAVGGIAFAEGEHCGITPKECQAAGKPVIVPDEPNLHNHVSDGETGVIVPPTAEGVRQGVRQVLDSTWDRTQLEAAADSWSRAAFRERARDLILHAPTARPDESADQQEVLLDD